MNSYLYILSLLLLLLSCSEEEAKPELSKEIFDTVAVSSDSDPEILPRTNSVSFENGKLVSGSLTTVLEDHLYLFSDSLLTNRSTIGINRGEKIYVDYVLPNSKIESNWLMPIYRVSVLKGDKEYEGFLPQKSLVAQKLVLNDGNMLLLSLLPSQGKEYSDVVGRYVVVNKSHEIQSELKLSMIFTPDFEDKSDAFLFNQSLVMEKVKEAFLKGANTIVNSHMYYGACGYLDGSNYCIWDGKKLHLAVSTAEMSEAGVVGDYAEVLFPKTNQGDADTILCSSIHIEYDTESEKEEEGKVILKDSIVSAYFWNGNQISGPDTLQVFKLK